MKKWIGLILSLAATAYTIWYMHYGVPYLNSGALSKIGLSHRFAFVIWGVLTMLALGWNIAIAYIRYTNTKLYVPLLSVSTVGMAMTLIFDFDFDKKLDYYCHCVGSLMFSVIMGVTIFLLFLLCYSKGKMFQIFTILTAGILLVDLVLLLIYQETGLIESLPVFAGYLLLCVTNFRRDRVEATR